MSSVARSGWRRAKSSIADEVSERTAAALADHAERQVEMLRQMSDMFREIARLSVDLGAVWQTLVQTRAELTEARELLASLNSVTSELRDTVSVQVDVENQSTELLGRLLTSTRSRVDELAEAVQVGP